MIRLLLKKDYEKYLQLINQFRPVKNITFNDFCVQYDKIFNSNSKILIYEKDNKIIGSITLIIEFKIIYDLSKVCHIEDIIVDNNFRRMGIGSSLLNEVKRIAKDENCYKVTLVCNKDISLFYKKNDFEIRGNHMSQLLL